MFDLLSEKFTDIFLNLRGYGRLTEKHINDGLRDVRVALLEADVALPVVLNFIEDIRTRSLTKEVLTSLTPGQALIKIVNEELIALMGNNNEPLKFELHSYGDTQQILKEVKAFTIDQEAMSECLYLTKYMKT